MGSEAAIKVENVSKTFRLPHEKNTSIKSAVVNFWRRKKGYELLRALEDVSFEVEKGEFFGIVGRNGSGKSTLLKLLAGTYTPSKGSIQVNGKLTPFIELGVGFNPELTGRENVYLNGALLGFNRKEMRKKYKEIVAFAELERFMDQKLKNYSSGMQVRLAFAIAVQAKSEILLLDEVLAVGDAAFQQKCYDYFEQLKLEERTIIFVTHDMDAVQRFCNRALMLEKGVIKDLGSPAEIADLYKRDNISQAAEGKSDTAKDASIKVKVNEPKDGKCTLEVDYKTSLKEKVYVGFSLIKNGVSVGELNNLEDAEVGKNKKLIYELDTTVLNPGVYEVGAVLFIQKNRRPIAMTPNRPKIVIDGYDTNRGGALKLEKTWVKQ